jgi:hypothetical protein
MLLFSLFSSGLTRWWGIWGGTQRVPGLLKYPSLSGEKRILEGHSEGTRALQTTPKTLTA